jgi:hypothetical protein
VEIYLRLFRDYAHLNRARMRTQWLSMGLGALLLEFAILKPISQEFSESLVLWSLLIALITLVGASVLVVSFNFLNAYAVAWLLARDSKVSTREYLQSQHYDTTVRPQLKQPELRFW